MGIRRFSGLLGALVLTVAGCADGTQGVQAEPPRTLRSEQQAPRIATPALERAAVASESDAREKAAGATPRQDAPTPEESTPAPIPPNTAVLHIGDSFVLAGFSQALRPRMKALGARYEVRSEQASYTTTWSSRAELVIANTQPNLVIITLGANEVANTDPPSHASAVRRIVQAVGDRACVWVTPPLWRKDTGIIAVIRENVAPCRFFDSDLHVPKPLPRQADKVHPSTEGGAIWAEAFWNWLEAERLPRSAASAKTNPWALKPGPREEYAPRTALLLDTAARNADGSAIR